MEGLSPALRAQMCKNFEKLRQYTPKEFTRKFRSTADLAFFKAKEFRAIGLYTGPIALKNILPTQHYNHFLTFHVAYRILHDEKMIHDYDCLEYAEQLLRNFVHDFAILYGEHLISFNVHDLLHITEDVRRFRKTLTALSSYRFQNKLGSIKQLVNSAHLPLVQVARRLHERNLFCAPHEEDVQKNKTPSLKKRMGSNSNRYKLLRSPLYTFDCNRMSDRFCVSRDNDIIMIEYFELNNFGEISAVGIKLHTKCLYDAPFDS